MLFSVAVQAREWGIIFFLTGSDWRILPAEITTEAEYKFCSIISRAAQLAASAFAGLGHDDDHRSTSTSSFADEIAVMATEYSISAAVKWLLDARPTAGKQVMVPWNNDRTSIRIVPPDLLLYIDTPGIEIGNEGSFPLYYLDFL